MIRSHPLTGVGLNNFRPLVAQYEDPGEKVIKLAHNTHLEIAAELGVPALIVFLGIFVAAFRALGRVRRRTHDAASTHLSNIALGMQAGLVAYLVSAFFVSAWWQKLVWLLIFLTMCLHGVSSVLRYRSNGTRQSRNGSWNAGASPDPADALECN